MQRILYLGLSNKIRGVAESLARDGRRLSFIKPGEVRSRVAIATNILAEQEIDIIVAAETLTEDRSQLESVISGLRTRRIAQPILGLTNSYTEKTMVAFFAAGGDVLLPLRQRPDKFFSINSQMLCSQIGRMINMAGRKSGTTPNTTSNTVGVSTPDEKPFYGFMIVPNGDILLHDCKLNLYSRERKVFIKFLSAKHRTVTRQEIQRILGNETPLDRKKVESIIYAIRKKTLDALKARGHQFDLPLIETVIGEGWRFNIQNLRQLSNYVSPNMEYPDDAIDLLPYDDMQPRRANLIGSIFSDFSFAPEEPRIFFRGLSLAFSPTHATILKALFLAEGRVLSRQTLYEICYPSGASATPNAIRGHINKASKALSEEIRRLGYPIEFPLVRCVGKSGWAVIPENLARLELMQPDGLLIGRATTLDQRVFSRQPSRLDS